MRYIVSVVEGYPTAIRGGKLKAMPLEASVLDTDDCFRQVAAFATRNSVSRERALQRANWHCEALNEQEDKWEAA